MKQDGRCDACGAMISSGWEVERNGKIYHSGCVPQEEAVGHHLTEDGKFKSDKYDWCPEGFFPLKFTDPKARAAIFLYAMLTVDDDDLARNLATALQKSGVGMMPKDLTETLDEQRKAIDEANMVAPNRPEE